MNAEIFLRSAIQQFRDYKRLGDRTFEQVPAQKFDAAIDHQNNSLAVNITHLHGNMLSRWTNFLTEDGEKEWRERDQEFEPAHLDKEALLQLWEAGWKVLFDTLESLTPADLDKMIYIRTKPLTVIEAIHRQLTHYAYHVGQVVLLGKHIAGDNWESLSIKKGASKLFNEKMKS